MKYLVDQEQIKEMVELDQLSLLRKSMEVLQGFSEGDITFAPTFKFIEGTNNYCLRESRVPSYTDRVLYKHKPKSDQILILENYDSNNLLKESDHKPVFAQFSCKIQEKSLGIIPEIINRKDALNKKAKEEEEFGKSKKAVCNLL